MKKGSIVLVVVLVLILLSGIYAVSKNNSFVALKENVNKASSDIDTALERRADLIPNLVSTVKGYVKHEESVIDSVTEARQNLLSAKSLDEKAAASSKLDSAISALMVIVENYPDLKASENFIQLQDELAGTENRIATARKDYNDAVKDYNSYIKRIPNSIIAGMFNFEKKDYFKADEGANEVPKVNFE